MSTNELVKIIQEIVTSDGDQGLPPYRHAEIAEAEEYVRNGRWHLQHILACHRQAIIITQTDLEHTKRKIALTASEETPLDLIPLRDALQARLKQQLEMPTVALAVMLSRLQQLKRGVTIYKMIRIRKLIAMCFHQLMTEASEASDCMGKKDIFAMRLPALSTCSEEERDCVGKLLAVLKEHEVEEMFEQFPTEPSLDHGRGWLHPATWLLQVAAARIEGSTGSRLNVPPELLEPPPPIQEWSYADILIAPKGNEMDESATAAQQ